MIQSISELLANTIYDFENGKNSIEKNQFINTGFEELNKKIAGFKKGSLSIVAGRPGMGKSSLSLSMAYNIAKQGNTVGYISAERTPKNLLYHIVATKASTTLYNFTMGTNQEKQLETLHTLKKQLKIHLLLSTKKVVTIEEVIKDCKKMTIEGAEIIFIDCLQIFASFKEADYVDYEKQENSSQAFEIVNQLQEFALRSNVSLVITSQVSMRVEWRGGDKRPQIDDLKWVDYIEDIADTIIFIYRYEYYDLIEDEEGNSTEGRAELIIAKNGLKKRGSCQLNYDDGARWFYS